MIVSFTLVVLLLSRYEGSWIGCAVLLTLAATPVDRLEKDDPKVDGKSESSYTFSNHF